MIWEQSGRRTIQLVRWGFVPNWVKDPREFSLLECLLRHAGQTLTRDQLLDQAWPFGVAVTPNAVDAYIHYLRDKLGAAGRHIQTIRGVGYRLADG